MPKLLVEDCQSISVEYLSLSGLSVFKVELNGQSVKIVGTECYYGGKRLWFLCPQCQRRSGKLYRKPLLKEFLCRNCNNLTYQLTRYRRSEQEAFFRNMHKLKGSKYN